MPTTNTKIVNGKKYLYYLYYDPNTRKKKEIYCGLADDPKSYEKAKQLEKDHIQQQITTLEDQLRTVEPAPPKPKKFKRVRTRTPKSLSGKDLEALEAIKKAEIYEPQIHYKSSENMVEVADGSVQLIVTSPPYNVGKDYTLYHDKKELNEYLDFLNRVWKECKRVLCEGGRIAVNVADTWRSPYIPLHSYITQQLIDLGFLMRGVIYWDKGASVGVSTAWGSWRSASNPTLRDVGEFIMIFCKDSYKLQSNNTVSTISSEEFTRYTKSLWSFPTTESRKNGHPSIYPDELPKRLIQLYTFLGDTVLDPFLGSGTSCKVAKAWGRRSIGYEIDESYRPIIDAKVGSASSLAIPLDAYSVNGRATLDSAVEEATAPVQSVRSSAAKSET